MNKMVKGALQVLLIILAASAVIMVVVVLSGSAALALLPLYRCHKKVCAAKILEIRHKPNPDKSGRTASYSYGAVLVVEMPDSIYTPTIEMDAEWMKKHNPCPGGYLVQYEDGYTSYSPADVFEKGYTLIDPDPADPWKPDPVRREPAFIAFGWSLAISAIVLMGSFAAAIAMIVTGVGL